VQEAPAAVIELEHSACRSRAPTMGAFTSGRSRHDTHYGKGIAQRTCAAADRTGHAMLHTLYQQSLKHEAPSSSNISRSI